MMKKNILLITLLFFFNNCGFTPVYLQNTNVNFSIEQINLDGDRELNNFLKSKLTQYKKNDNKNKIFIEAISKYEKIVLSKDGTGEVSNYQLEGEVIFFIKPTNKKIIITEKKIMESMTDKFEETEYERSIKQNFASSIVYKLISELTINK